MCLQIENIVWITNYYQEILHLSMNYPINPVDKIMDLLISLDDFGTDDDGFTNGVSENQAFVSLDLNWS